MNEDVKRGLFNRILDEAEELDDVQKVKIAGLLFLEAGVTAGHVRLFFAEFSLADKDEFFQNLKKELNR